MWLILTSTLASFCVAHTSGSTYQEREEHLQTAIDELLNSRPLLAIKNASAAVEMNPQSVEAQSVLGLSHLRCGEWEKAESCFNNAIANDSLSPEAHLGLGIIAFSKMRYREAIQHLRRATSSELFPGEAYRELALSLEGMNLHKEASLSIQEASKYTDEFSVDERANARAFADIFAAYGDRTLYRIAENFRSTSVHITYSDAHITLPIMLNGTISGDFVFDTGHRGSLMISDAFAESLNLTYVGEIAAASLAGELRLKAAILDSVEIGGLVMSDVPVLICESYPFQAIGVMGWEIIQKVNTTIDFEEMQIQLSNLDDVEWHGERLTDEASMKYEPFIYIKSMYVIARFGDNIPRPFVFDTGANISYLHRSDSNRSEYAEANLPCTIRIGDFSYDQSRRQFIDFSDIHKKGRYYFPGVIGLDVLRHNILYIFPRESMMFIEKGK